jgi:hypothetical protein
MNYLMTCQQIKIISKGEGYMTQALVIKAFLKSKTLKFLQNRVETSYKNNRTTGVTLKKTLLKAEVLRSPVLLTH